MDIQHPNSDYHQLVGNHESHNYMAQSVSVVYSVKMVYIHVHVIMIVALYSVYCVN